MIQNEQGWAFCIITGLSYGDHISWLIFVMSLVNRNIMAPPSAKRSSCPCFVAVTPFPHNGLKGITITSKRPICNPVRTKSISTCRGPSRPLYCLSDHAQSENSAPSPVESAADQNPERVSVILLAGGSGSRMKADRPKQFLQLDGKTVLEHSITLFGHLPEVQQLIVVLASEYHADFAPVTKSLPCPVCFAEPGVERQDSVYNGLALVSQTMQLACVHDAARPLVTIACIRQVCRDAMRFGAAVLGVPSKATIKESADGQFVLRTIPRDRLWEIQTPQVIKPSLLRRGFDKVRAEGLAVTDDVSIVEQLGEPVKITMGEYTNIKLTTPEDMNIAESILQERSQQPAVPAQ